MKQVKDKIGHHMNDSLDGIITRFGSNSHIPVFKHGIEVNVQVFILDMVERITIIRNLIISTRMGNIW